MTACRRSTRAPGPATPGCLRPSARAGAGARTARARAPACRPNCPGSPGDRGRARSGNPPPAPARSRHAPPGSPPGGMPRRPRVAARRAAGRPRAPAARTAAPISGPIPRRLLPGRPSPPSVQRDPHPELEHAVLHGRGERRTADRRLAIAAEIEVADRCERYVRRDPDVVTGTRDDADPARGRRTATGLEGGVARPGLEEETSARGQVVVDRSRHVADPLPRAIDVFRPGVELRPEEDVRAQRHPELYEAAQPAALRGAVKKAAGAAGQHRVSPAPPQSDPEPLPGLGILRRARGAREHHQRADRAHQTTDHAHRYLLWLGL